MTLICRPKGRGNWRTVVFTIDASVDLFPALRDEPVVVGMLIHFAGLALRVVELRP
ncbi:MAG: hypothetical protein V4718_04360 [Pseudomonadota bacterium]